MTMKIALLGYGKMGKVIEGIAQERNHEIVLKINSQNRDLLTVENLRNADVAIDFSIPDTAFENVMIGLKAGIPVISGTTAWLDKLPEVEAFCKQGNGAFIYASNFSLGVNLFFELNKKLADLMAPHDMYDISMTEVHHTQKLDAPSGTAISLAEDLIEQVDRLNNWGLDQKSEGVLNIHADRIDPAPGTHIVHCKSAIDSIEISHTAHNRSGFALGAVIASEWIAGKKGCFTMKDVLFS